MEKEILAMLKIEPKWLGVKATCALLEISSTTLWRWKSNYLLNVSVIGDKVYYNYNEIVELQDSMSTYAVNKKR